MYSLHATQEDMDQYYDKAIDAYKRCYERLGIGDTTYVTFAAGGAFTKYSHEFQTVSDAGEDTIHISREKNIAVNEEVFTDEVLTDLSLERGSLETATSIEVGNIFKLGTRFSEPLGLFFKNENEEMKPVIMGSYGIGPGRLMGTIIETLSDEKGMVWPASVAPFQIHLIALRAKEEGDALYERLTKAGVEVFYDDREEVSAGEKFADADLIGLPYRVVISEKTLKEGKLELKMRGNGEVKMITEEELRTLVG